MKKSLFLTLLLLLCPAFQAKADPAFEVIREINVARTNPDQYVTYLKEWKAKFLGHRVKLSDSLYLRTQEGVWAVDEAIEYMQKRNPVEPMAYSKGLALTAARMAQMQGTAGQTGHIGPDGLKLADRARLFGRWSETLGENIAYGLDDPMQIVMMWIIDDGVKGREHRHSLFRREFRVLGVGFHSHTVWQVVCVADFAGGFETFDLGF